MELGSNMVRSDVEMMELVFHIRDFDGFDARVEEVVLLNTDLGILLCSDKRV